MEVVHDFILAFQRWCALDGKVASGPKYVGYLSCFNREYAEPTHSTWDGLYAYAYGHVAPKEVVEVGSFREFESLYGVFRFVILSSGCPVGMNAERYAKILDWYNKPAVKGPSCLNAALNAYRDFLIWKTLQEPILSEFAAWLALPERNKGKGLAEKTQSRYVKAIVFLDSAMRSWGIDPDSDLWSIGSLIQLSNVETQIRNCPQFENYNGNKAQDGSSKNLNGTGFLDPSAALSQFCEFRKKMPIGHVVSVETGMSDCLSVALKLFQQGRAEKGLDGWASFDAWAKEARTQFAKADAAMFTEADFDYAGFMRKFVYNPTVANNSFKNHTAAEKAVVGNFISQNRQSPQAVSWYLNPANRPAVAGMGVGVMLNFMMKVRPAEFATYSSMLDRMLVFTGVAKEPSPQEITVESYEANKALQGQVLAKMHELGIGKTADDNSPADYLTVNEFAWWLSDEKNQNLVKEEIMSKQMKKSNDMCDMDSNKSIVDELKEKTDSMMARLTASLLTKPFVILAGASGTGKSRMVKKLAYMTCRADMLRNPHDETPGNYCMIAVKPNWHDSSELLGYKSAFAGHEYVSSDFVKFILKAFAFPKTPFFVCLDEMNLAPVEQYFAEYLSAVESAGKNKNGEWVSDPLIQRGEFGGDVLNLAPEYELPENVRTTINEKGLYIPKNLFVVGTVNMDDTTNQFSRKVLDRAMTIMMNEVDFGKLKGSAYEKLTNDLRIKNGEIAKFIDRAVFDGAMLDEGFEMLLNDIKRVLIDSPFEIGYRFAIETALYREALGFLTGKATKGEGESAKAERKELSLIAVDHLVLMKVLPRIIGTLAEREAVLKELKAFLGSFGTHHQLSATMLERMTKFAENNGGYISFWP